MDEKLTFEVIDDIEQMMETPSFVVCSGQGGDCYQIS